MGDAFECFWRDHTQSVDGIPEETHCVKKMPSLARKLNELVEAQKHLKLIKWLQKKKILKRKIKCNYCGHKLKLKQSDCIDNFEW